MDKLLLSIVEYGGYPDFTSLYQEAGYQVITANAMRKVVSLLKKKQPDMIIGEFNFQSDFRDRTSNLETLMATAQTRCPDARFVIFYELEQREHLERLLSRFPVHATLPFPVDAGALREAIAFDD